jgi:hypothetical protein
LQKQGLQGEEVRCAGDSLKTNTVSQPDMLAGLRGQVKKDKKVVWLLSIFGSVERLQLQGVDSLKGRAFSGDCSDARQPNL